MNCDGRNVAVPGQPPAQQRLGADDAAVAQVDLRLVVDHELVALDRAPQLALEHQPLDRRRVHLLRIEGEGIAAVLLRVIHGGIGIADQVDDIVGIARAEGDADTHGQEHFLLVDVKSRAGGIQHGARQLRHLFARLIGVGAQPVDEQRELVAREAAEHGFAAQHARQPFGEHLEHAVAGSVAEGVVHLLEAVHVDVQQRHPLADAPRTRDRLLQQVLELHPVRNLGERVVARQVADAALGALAFGDVARDVDVAGKLRIGAVDRRDHERDRDGLPGAGAQHGLARIARRRQRIAARLHLPRPAAWPRSSRPAPRRRTRSCAARRH